jgi:single-stranded-DNA-specific exonuclease
MPTKWVEPLRILPSLEIRDEFKNSFLLAEQLAKRKITSKKQAERFLNLDCFEQASPYDFPDMEKATIRIRKAINNKELIGVWGDFDVDGQTSTAILVDGLRRSGAEVAFQIPVRGKESHGIQLDSLKKFLVESKPEIIITCDTGISEFESMDFLSSIEIDAIITDHHTPADKLPTSYAIINPRLLSDSHPLFPLAGVGTAFQLIRALFADQGQKDLEKSFYDLIALGTIADLADLISENRYYTKIGLQLMSTTPRSAIKEMEKLSGIKNAFLNESQVGFMLAPRLNAIGRLDDANPIVNFFLSDNEKEISIIANKLEELNIKRKLSADMVYRSAIDVLEKNKELLQYPAIVISHENWEKGVVGIAASRLVEKYNKPAILLNQQGKFAAGSARSVEGINIIKAIQESRQYLNKFGGHPMAAGLSMEVINIPEFREGLSTSILKMTSGKILEKQMEIDSYLPLDSINDSLLLEIDRLAPFGPGNPAPVLVSRNIEIEETTFIGKSREHRKIIVKDQRGNSKNVIWWNSAGSTLPTGQFDLAYNVRRDNFQSISELVLEWLDYRENEESIEINQPISRFIIHDFRSTLNQKEILDQLFAKPDVFFWPKIQNQGKNPHSKEEDLEKGKILAILNPPPDRETIKLLVEKTDPSEIYLLKSSYPDDSLEAFIKNLLGLIKYSLSNKSGSTSLEELSETLVQSQRLVLLGLELLESKGLIEITKEGNNINIKRTNKPATDGSGKLETQLKKSLDEAYSFRSFYLRADSNYLLSGM